MVPLGTPLLAGPAVIVATITVQMIADAVFGFMAAA